MEKARQPPVTVYDEAVQFRVDLGTNSEDDEVELVEAPSKKATSTMLEVKEQRSSRDASRAESGSPCLLEHGSVSVPSNKKQRLSLNADGTVSRILAPAFEEDGISHISETVHDNNTAVTQDEEILVTQETNWEDSQRTWVAPRSHSFGEDIGQSPRRPAIVSSSQQTPSSSRVVISSSLTAPSPSEKAEKHVMTSKLRQASIGETSETTGVVGMDELISMYRHLDDANELFCQIAEREHSARQRCAEAYCSMTEDPARSELEALFWRTAVKVAVETDFLKLLELDSKLRKS